MCFGRGAFSLVLGAALTHSSHASAAEHSFPSIRRCTHAATATSLGERSVGSRTSLGWGGMEKEGTGWDGTGWDGMGRDGTRWVGWDGMGWDGERWGGNRWAKAGAGDGCQVGSDWGWMGRSCPEAGPWVASSAKARAGPPQSPHRAAGEGRGDGGGYGRLAVRWASWPGWDVLSRLHPSAYGTYSFTCISLWNLLSRLHPSAYGTYSFTCISFRRALPSRVALASRRCFRRLKRGNARSMHTCHTRKASCGGGVVVVLGWWWWW